MRPSARHGLEPYALTGQEAKLIGDEFLALEKFVNLNYLVRLAPALENMWTFTAVKCRCESIVRLGTYGPRKGALCLQAQNRKRVDESSEVASGAFMLELPG